MNYLRREWDNYGDKTEIKRVALVGLSIVEDCLRWFLPLGKPWWLFMPVWKTREWISQGKKRRLLRRFVKEWAKSGIMSQDYFYKREHKRKDRQGQVVVITVEWKTDFSLPENRE